MFWGSFEGLFLFFYLLFLGCLEQSLRWVQLVSCACTLWIRSLLCSSSSSFWRFCLWGVFNGIWSVSFQFSLSSRDCLSLIALSWCWFFYFMSWLLVCLWGFLGSFFTGTPPGGGRMGMANREESIYFSAFLIIGAFGWNGRRPKARVFAKFFVSKTCI